MKNFIYVVIFTFCFSFSHQAQENSSENLTFKQINSLKFAELNGEYKPDLLFKHFLNSYRKVQSPINGVGYQTALSVNNQSQVLLNSTVTAKPNNSNNYNLNQTVSSPIQAQSRYWNINSRMFEGFSTILINGDKQLSDLTCNVRTLTMKDIKTFAINELSDSNELYFTLMDDAKNKCIK
jgi:hypothetical protein